MPRTTEFPPRPFVVGTWHAPTPLKTAYDLYNLALDYNRIAATHNDREANALVGLAHAAARAVLVAAYGDRAYEVEEAYELAWEQDADSWIKDQRNVLRRAARRCKTQYAF